MKVRAKKAFKIILIILLCLIIALAGAAGVFAAVYKPALILDFSQKTGQVTSGASGYLYGIAQDGVPSREMCESVDISSVSQKVTDGLQHPIGDIGDVYTSLDNTDYNVVYLQDVYDTWYYKNDEIMKQRQKGSYDWQKLLKEDYLPKVEQSVKKLSKTKYSDKVVYCIYNECDNGVWFGETKKTYDKDNKYGVYGDYNKKGRDNFNSAWKQTYELVKSINPNALIGGPGFCDYDSDEISYFINFCVKNNCIPDVMIYHELGDGAVYYWQDHVNDYRKLEKSLKISKLPIIVTEYGRMQDNGYPGEMIKYITQIETSKVYGNNAYWRLADNLNDVCADDNCPNANWWLMRWYADMQGQTVKGEYHDLMKSDFKKSVQQHKNLNYKGFMGIASITDAEDEINIICGGGDSDAKVVLKNLCKTKLNGKTVEINIEQTVYKGLYGVVNSPVEIKKYTADVTGEDLVIDMSNLDSANAYHIVIKAADEAAVSAYENTSLPERYEFEDGEILGGAYTYESYCPASGKNENLVGGMEKDGDGVQITVNLSESGIYDLDFIYGNSNDGKADENGRQNPDDRKTSVSNLTIDGDEQQMSFANTIKSEYTACQSMSIKLKAGEHTIKITHNTGTIVLDSLIATLHQQSDSPENITVLPDADRTTAANKSFIAIAPKDSYYSVTTPLNIVKMTVGSAEITTNEIGAATVYLKRGINYIDVETNQEAGLTISEFDDNNASFITLVPKQAKLSGGAKLEKNSTALVNGKVQNLEYLSSINSKSGKAVYKFKASKAGAYKATVLYSNNDEGGAHDYNVDLIERYMTVDVNGKKQNVYCRNTYSWDTYKTVTFTVNLKKGENKIVLSNDGSNKFNNADTSAPDISVITLNPAQQ